MTTTVNNEHKNIKVPNKQEQNQTCLDAAEREGLRPKGNIPNLRFPEFQEEWEKCKLGTLTTKVGSGSTPKGGNAVYTSTGHCFVRSQNVGMGYLILDDVAHINDGIHQKHKATELKEDDVLLNITGASIGRTAIATKEIEGGNVNQHVCIIRANSKVSPKFLCNYIQTKKIQNYIQSLQTGGSREGLNFEQIRSFPISLPNIAEQNKIAQLFDKLNERIATQNKIIDKLQSLIKGIMVELQKQGVNKGTWKKVFLSDVLTERNERNTNLFQVFSVSVSQGVVNQVDYLGRSFAAKDTSKYNVVHYGDLVYTKSPTGSFPYGIVKQSLNHENVAVSPLYGVYKPHSLAVGVYLQEYFMSEINTHNYLHPLIQKGAKNTINITNQRFLDNSVLLPINTNEMLLISKLLCSLNNKIKYQQDILQQYQKQKQYLLRQMFI